MPRTICAAIYVVLAVALTWPLVLVLDTHVPRDLGDPLLSIWTLWWNAEHLPFTSGWWDALQFHPVPGSIAFSDHRVGLTLISQPVQWAGGSPVAAYNLALLLSFPLSAAAAHLVVHSLTRRHDAALIAGLAFGFNPYRVAHLEHLELVSSYWMPVALFALHKLVDEPRTRWAVLFGIAWLLQALCSSYYLFYFSVLVGLWLVWFARGLPIRSLAALAACWTAAGALLLPLLLAYREIHAAFDLHRTADEIRYFSADITAIVSGSPLLAFWRSSAALDRQEGQLFPGAFACAIVLAAVLLARERHVARASRVHHVLLLFAALFGLLALTPVLFGPWKIVFGGLSASASGFRKPLSVTAACLVLYCLVHPRLRAAWHAKSAFAFYVSATIVLWVFSWGPEPRLMGVTVLYEAPYAWLMRLPGFESGLRVPARFAMPGILALSIAAGLAFARIVPVDRRAARLALLALVSVGIAADGWIRQLPLLTPPPSWTAPVDPGAFAAVLELPVVHGAGVDAAAVYRSISHRHPTVNGFSGHFPPHYVPMRLGFERGERDVLSTLAAAGPLLVAIHADNDPEGDWRQYVSHHEGAAKAGSNDGWTFFLLPAADARAPAISGGRNLPLSRITSNFSSQPSSLLTDGDMRTRWVTPTPQRGDEALVIDTGAVHDLRGVTMLLGVFREDFPRGLAIEVSMDGERWTTGWTGRTAGATVAAVLRDPHRTALPFPIAATARFVRLRQTESDPTYYWSVAEVAVIGDRRE
jgi:F5/8 type C domain